MFKWLFVALSFFITLYANDILPLQTIKTNGEVIDLLVKNGKIYATTDSGKADIFDLKSKKLLKEIKFEKIKDIFGDLNDVRVFSIDTSEDKIILATQGEKGFSRVYLYLLL